MFLLNLPTLLRDNCQELVKIFRKRLTINHVTMIHKITGKCCIALIGFLFLFSSQPISAQPDGKVLFQNNCASCHATSDSKVIGPGLKDVEKRRTLAWLLPWIKNSQAVIKSGEATAVKLFEENNKVVMPSQALNDEEIKAVLAYVKAENDKAPAVATTAAPVAGAASGEDEGFPWMLVIVVIALIGIYAILNRVKKSLERVVRQNEGTPEPVVLKGKAGTKHWIREHKKLIAVFLIVGAVVSSYKGWYALAGIGQELNYQPDQPIKFSHAMHAGTNGINCKYCHSGAEKSKNAGIPSPNVCMNCHKYVQTGAQYGKEEIQKIYDAVGWDASKAQYTGPGKAIQWVRIHNLPDLAYFNHSQHVVVGKIECQTCHGPVQEMEVVKQFSPLNMGWCIQCHRDTEVKMEGNGYYTALHEDMKKQYGKDAKITVDKIGGLECARCHY